MLAHYQRFDSYDDFLDDVDLAWKQATAIGKTNDNRSRGKAVGMQVLSR